MSNEEKIISLLTEIKELLERNHYSRNEDVPVVTLTSAGGCRKVFVKTITKTIRKYL